jgi:hypothetical protein
MRSISCHEILDCCPVLPRGGRRLVFDQGESEKRSASFRHDRRRRPSWQTPNYPLPSITFKGHPPVPGGLMIRWLPLRPPLLDYVD